MSPDHVMRVIQRGQNRPAPIHLGVIAVELRDEEEERREGEGEAESGDERVRGEVDLGERGCAEAGCKDAVWQLVEGGDVWLDGEEEVAAVFGGFDGGQRGGCKVRACWSHR